MNISPLTLTVTQLNEYVKSMIDSSSLLKNVYVKGEISNFTNHYKSGHFYFTLKDEKSLIKAVMFSSSASRLKFLPENHMKVIVRGRISVFTRDGVYQLYAENMEPDGLGELYAAFEQLKNRLQKEGLFDDGHKVPLPRFPKRIGIVTSPTGAAVADMKNILTRRYPLCEILIYPALVQGERAPRELVAGIAHFDRDALTDVIIIGRGGGSLEDLWAFNSEELARAIFSCQTPVISAVGHETDFTICDFVSDLRAPTPSAAAELAVPDQRELTEHLLNMLLRFQKSVKTVVSEKKNTLSRFAAAPFFKSPQYFIEERQMELLSVEKRISAALFAIVAEKKNALSSHAGKLSALNPIAVLSRGFSAVYTKEETLIKSIRNIKPGDEINVRLIDGHAFAKVTGIKRN